jgi:hypothetical protein
VRTPQRVPLQHANAPVQPPQIAAFVEAPQCVVVSGSLYEALSAAHIPGLRLTPPAFAA